MRQADIRVCPCGDSWATLDHEKPGSECPTCRQKIRLSRLVGGRLPGEPEGPKVAPPPALDGEEA